MADTNVTLAATPRIERPAQASPRRTCGEECIEHLISAALLTTAAFRMRDREALDDALRILVRVTEHFGATEFESAA